MRHKINVIQDNEMQSANTERTVELLKQDSFKRLLMSAMPSKARLGPIAAASIKWQMAPWVGSNSAEQVYHV